MVERIPEDYAEGEYRKVRKALFDPWYDFDDRVIERYEERLARLDD